MVASPDGAPSLCYSYPYRTYRYNNWGGGGGGGNRLFLPAISGNLNQLMFGGAHRMEARPSMVATWVILKE
ncbi:hypothetical protein BHM03_00016205 [Ensete ventricosum]|nr:hypothetical protein BHM03_00016205 [Ensete ventricosum]